MPPPATAGASAVIGTRPSGIATAAQEGNAGRLAELLAGKNPKPNGHASARTVEFQASTAYYFDNLGTLRCSPADGVAQFGAGTEEIGRMPVSAPGTVKIYDDGE